MLGLRIAGAGFVTLAFVLGSSAALAGCRSKGTSTATITVKESGKAEISFGSRKAELPVNDVGKEPTVTQDEGGRRLAYRTAGGGARILYVVGDGLFVGPAVAQPADFRAVPDIDHALGPLFEAAGARRADLVREVRREKGEAGVAQLLVAAVYVDDPAWEDAQKHLAPDHARALRDGLANALEPGKSPVVLRRAVAVVDLKAPDRAKLVAARARELVTVAKEPHAAAVLLRAVIANDKREAATIGCEVLSKLPSSEIAGADKLVEAATLAIAAADADCPEPDLLVSFWNAYPDSCLPFYRCNDAGPLSWGDTSKQDEVLCTKAHFGKAIASELERSAADVLDSAGARPGLFALASLASKDRLAELPMFFQAHARRRYALTQPAAPGCDDVVELGTACHCDEAAVRLAACVSSGAQAASGICRFEVDDRQKKIHSVVRGAPTP